MASVIRGPLPDRRHLEELREGNDVWSEGGRWEDPAVGHGSALTCRSAPRSDPWRVAWVQQRLGRLLTKASLMLLCTKQNFGILELD